MWSILSIAACIYAALYLIFFFFQRSYLHADNGTRLSGAIWGRVFTNRSRRASFNDSMAIIPPDCQRLCWSKTQFVEILELLSMGGPTALIEEISLRQSYTHFSEPLVFFVVDASDFRRDAGQLAAASHAFWLGPERQYGSIPRCLRI